MFDNVRLYTFDEDSGKRKSSLIDRAYLQLQQPFPNCLWCGQSLTCRCEKGTKGMDTALGDWLENFRNQTEGLERAVAEHQNVCS